jgi:hypothetical protein
MTSKLDIVDSSTTLQSVPSYEIAPVESDQIVPLPNHDDHHGPAIAPTKVPEWLGNIIEKVFKVKKRGTTVEVRSMILCFHLHPHRSPFS